MSKYTFFNDVISDEALVRCFAEALKSDLLIQGFNLDDIRILVNKFIAQYDYKISYDFVDFNNKNEISKYGLKHNTDIYAKKNGKKDIYIVFNKNIKPNLNRYLLLKALAYELFDKWEQDEELRLNLKASASNNDDILAERLAIEMIITRSQYKYLKDFPQNDSFNRLKNLLEVELEEIRNKEYDDGKVVRTWTLVSVSK